MHKEKMQGKTSYTPYKILPFISSKCLCCLL